MFDSVNEMSNGDDKIMAIGIWVLGSIVAVIGFIALLYYLRYVYCLMSLLLNC